MADSRTSQVEDSPLLVAAFDFGTTFSGYAFSFHNDPLKVQTNQHWVAGSERLTSLKTPTCILLDPEEKFHSFGFEAENKYNILVEDDEHQDWCFFRRFKMLLHNNKKLSRRTTIEDITGKRMFAIDIFSMALHYLRTHLLSTLQTQISKIEETDIKYVITVPAIWDDNGKQFMRMAAQQADIDTNRLKLALEPEAASFWCQTLTDEADAALSKPGAQYMVVDLGGGTADISVHERKEDGTLKELHKPSGGPWGGVIVDNNFFSWLEHVFGKNVIQRLKLEHMADYFDMLREFETNKRSVNLDKMEYLQVRVPPSLRELTQRENGKTFEEHLNSFSTKPNVTIKRDKMRIDIAVARSWFDGPIDNVLVHINNILSKPEMQGIQSILLVGGFGENLYVQRKFKNAIQKKRLIVPAEAGMAVLKGAVRFGHQPTLMSERIMKHTYGISVYRHFNKAKHNASFITIVNGKNLVANCFSVYVRCGDSIPLGYESTHTILPTDMEQTCLLIFCTEVLNPKYTTDSGCKMLGHLSVRHPDGDNLEDKTLDVTMVFGDTEVTVKAKVAKTGKECHATIDYLNDNQLENQTNEFL